MSSRIPVDQFGSNISGSHRTELDLYHANKIFVNESGDIMTGGLNMNNHKVTNVGDTDRC